MRLVRPAFAAALAVACAAAQAQPIKIGLITARSGVFALFGTAAEKGEMLAADELNKHAGATGRTIEFISADSKSSPEEASRLFRDFASKGVVAVIGNVGSAETAAISALAKEAKVPFFTTVGYGRSLTEELGHKYFFRPVVNSRAFATPLAERLGKKKYKTYCAINNDYALGHDVNDGFFAELKKFKPDVQVLPGCEFWVPLGATDFTSYITAIMSKKPDVVVFSGLIGGSGRAFLTQGRSFGLFKVSVGAHASMGWPGNNDGLRKQDIPENVVTATDYPYPPVQRKENIAFFNAYKARWSEVPLSESAYGYATVRYIAKSLDGVKPGDTDAFIAAAEKGVIDHPAAGPVKVRAFDHQAEMGVWVGTLAWDETNKRAGMSGVRYIPGSNYLPTAEQITEMRKVR
jgi:branched-chain amino acid transport system substrate-binding protein